MTASVLHEFSRQGTKVHRITLIDGPNMSNLGHRSKKVYGPNQASIEALHEYVRVTLEGNGDAKSRGAGGARNTMQWPLEVLVATADADTRRSLTDMLAESGLNPVICSRLSEAQSTLVRHAICLVFCDYCLPDGDFRDVLHEVNRHASSIPVVVANRMGDRRQFLNVLKSGAFDYLDSIWPRHEMRKIVSQALSTASLPSLEPLPEMQKDL